MFSSTVSRGALWLTGGILATVLGAVVNHFFHQRVIAVATGLVFAIAFGMAIERITTALGRGASQPDSLPLPQDSPDDIGAGRRTGPAEEEQDHLPRLPSEQRHQHHGSRHA